MDVNQLLTTAIGHHKKGEFDQAMAIYGNIIQVVPRNPDAHHLLGCAYKSLHQLEEAIASISSAIILSPQAVFYNSLGSTYMEKNEVIVAELCFKHALVLDPQYDDAQSNLGLNYIKQTRYEEAIPLLEHLTQRYPQHELAQINLARSYLMMSRYEDALASYQSVIKNNPKNYAAQVGLAMVVNEMRDTDGAYKIIANIPEKEIIKSIEGLKLRATLLEILGNLDAASEAYDAAIAAFPNNLEFFVSRVALKKLKKEDSIFLKMQEIAPRFNQLPPVEKAELGYAIGKCYQDVGDISSAAPYYAAGAAAKLQTFQFEELNNIRFAQHVKETMTLEYIQNLQKQGVMSDKPIFILGMPRSGTSLTEQILASHSHVFPGGELTFIPEALNNYQYEKGVVVNQGAKSILKTSSSITERANYYLQQLDTIPGIGQQKHVTDKLPGNFYMIGQIVAMFPNAKIIHCRRDPIDNCISCYTTLFSNGHEWTFDFDLLARAYRRYWDMMAYWRQILPGRFLEIRYEESVDDIDMTARKLLDWCGLDWDPKVLQFYETQRSVRTASITQVRQPIYSSSVGRWKKWEPHIQRLLHGLEDIEKQYWAE